MPARSMLPLGALSAMATVGMKHTTMTMHIRVIKNFFIVFLLSLFFSPHTQAVSKKETKSQTLSLSIAFIIPVEPSLSSATPWDKVL